MSAEVDHAKELIRLRDALVVALTGITELVAEIQPIDKRSDEITGAALAVAGAGFQAAMGVLAKSVLAPLWGVDLEAE